MLTDTLDAFFAAAADPVLLCDGSGRVLWSNAAARRLAARKDSGPPDLSALLGPEQLRHLKSISHFAIMEAELPGESAPVKQTALAVSTGSGDPGEDRFWIMFKSCPPSGGGGSRQEDLLAAVAHDLKNPLGAVFGYADTLLDSPAGEGLGAEHRVILGKIRKTAARSVELVKNYEHLFQLRAPLMAAAVQGGDLNQSVTGVVEYAWREDGAGTRLRLELAPGALPVRLERSQLERVVSNLFSNAVKYTSPGGLIAVRTRRSGQQAELEVFNSGPPIPAAELPALFDKYTRGSTGRNISGSGLGLYIVKAIVDAAGGEVSVASSAADGTLFTVKLPLNAPPSAQRD